MAAIIECDLCSLTYASLHPHIIIICFTSPHGGVKDSGASQTASPTQLPNLQSHGTPCFTLTRHWKSSNGSITMPPVMDEMPLHNICLEMQGIRPTTILLIRRLLTYHQKIHYLQVSKHKFGWISIQQHM
jgi:hypothetical protein